MSPGTQKLQEHLDRLLVGPQVDATAAMELLMREALAMGASDLVLDPRPGGFEVTVRVDGVMQTLARGPASALPNLVNRVKVLAGLLTYRTDRPQEGQIPPEAFGAEVDFRAAVYPAVHGSRVAIRIFDPAQKDFTLGDLGLPGDMEATLAEAVARPEGVVLLTGPAGSGKTTTIYALLRHMVRSDAARRARRSIITIEDPVEVMIDGITQTTTREVAGLDFSRALRSLLRQDPNVLVVGEVRDRETARVAIEAGLTGHLVIATIHAGSACGVFSRLLEMAVEPYYLTGAVSLVLAQRLPRRLCRACGGEGCDACRQTGFAGRLLLAEQVVMTPSLAEGINERLNRHALEGIACREGLVPLAQRGRLAVQGGLTTDQEIRRVLAV